MGMNLLQFYLLKISEEAGEIAKDAQKAMQFGLNNRYKYSDPSNKQSLHNEINDLLAVIEELNETFDFGFTPDRDHIKRKKAKIKVFLGKSIALGNVDPSKSFDSKEDFYHDD